MPLGSFGNVPGANASPQELSEAFSRLLKEVSYLLNGGLDSLNVNELNADVIIANTITANKMNVTELSAITANLGHITAGLIEAVTIVGSEIMTRAANTYPRAAMSSTNNLFQAEGAVGKNISVEAGTAGTPGLFFNDPLGAGSIVNLDTSFLITTPGPNGKNLKISSGKDLPLAASNDVDLQPTGSLRINGTSGFTGTFAAGTTGNLLVTVKKGIITSVV